LLNQGKSPIMHADSSGENQFGRVNPPKVQAWMSRICKPQPVGFHRPEADLLGKLVKLLPESVGGDRPH